MYRHVWDHMKGQVHDKMIQRDIDSAYIPFDPRNKDYQNYLKWLDEGNKPEPVTPPPTPSPKHE